MTLKLATCACCCLVIAAVFAPGPAGAQSTQAVLSQPSGGLLTLDGDLKIHGASPLVLDEPLRGDYVLTARKEGYVTQKARLRFPAGGGPGEPAGSSPVSSMGGVVRTVLLPGVGQWSAGEKGQGAALLTAEAGALAMAFKADADQRAARNDHDLIQDRISRNDGSTLGTLDRVDLDVAALRAQNRLDDARSARRQWALLAGAAWAYSVIDQAFLRGGLQVRARGLDTLQATLRPVSRAQAVARSLVVPGTGQSYAGHSGRGAWLLLLSGGLTGVSLAAGQHLDRTISDEAEAQLRYDELKGGTTDMALLDAARDHLAARYGQARDARSLRNVLWSGLALVWGLNVVDALVMEIPGRVPASLSPSSAAAGDAPRGGMFAQIQPGALRLGVRRGF